MLAYLKSHDAENDCKPFFSSKGTTVGASVVKYGKPKACQCLAVSLPCFDRINADVSRHGVNQRQRHIALTRTIPQTVATRGRSLTRKSTGVSSVDREHREKGMSTWSGGWFFSIPTDLSDLVVSQRSPALPPNERTVGDAQRPHVSKGHRVHLLRRQGAQRKDE